MIMMIFFKMDKVDKGAEIFYLSSGTKKSIWNFCETIPLKGHSHKKVCEIIPLNQGCGSRLDPDSVTLWIQIHTGNPAPVR
jgi:hypothetical protein